MSKNQAVARVRPKAAPGDQSRAAAHNPGVLRLPGLPVSWQRTALGEVLQAIIGGGTPSKSKPEYFQGHIPLMTVKDMRERRPSDTGFRITEEALQNSSAKLVPADTLIIATRMGLGKVVRAPFETAINQDLKALFPADGIEKSFLEYWLVSIAGKLEGMGTGTTVKGLRLEQVKSLEFPVAPLNEQHRIVEKIETLFARIDKGEEALREVQKLLKRYRQSILKAAVTGELTRGWREANKDNLEPASDLLARILEIRRENWQGRGKYKEPAEAGEIGIPKVPETWVAATVDQLSLKVEYGSSAKCSADTEGVPVLRMGNIVDGKVRYGSLKFLPREHDEFPKLLLEDGDLLFNRTNSAELVGKTAVFRSGPEECSFASYLIRVKTYGIIPEFLSAFINSGFGRQWIKSVVSQQVGQANVNGTKLKHLTVPLPPEKEQEEIVSQLEAMEFQASQLEEVCDTELVRSGRFRQSILKSAFTGKLVPQNPNDEPASELLARIRTGA